MAHCGWRQVQPPRGAGDIRLVHNGLKQHKQVQIRPSEINLIQHIAEIIPFDSGQSSGHFPDTTSGAERAPQNREGGFEMLWLFNSAHAPEGMGFSTREGYAELMRAAGRGPRLPDPWWPMISCSA